MSFHNLLTLLLASLATASTRAYHASPHPSSSPESSIRNLLSHYCMILDTKTYSSLSEVYTSDAIANFTTVGLGVLSGLPAFQKAMKKELGNLSTIHDMTSSWIYDVHVSSDDDDNDRDSKRGEGKGEAKGVTYYILEQFGEGEKAGRLFTFWGKWEDEFVLEDVGWRIKNRQVLHLGGPLIGEFEVPAH